MKNAKLLNREPSVEELLQPESNVAKRTEMAIVFYGSDRGNIVHSPAYITVIKSDISGLFFSYWNYIKVQIIKKEI